MELRKISCVYSWIPKERRKKILDLIYGIKTSGKSNKRNFLVFCFKTLRVRQTLANLHGFYAFFSIFLEKKQALGDAGREILLVTGKDYLIEGLNYNGSTKDTQSLIEDLKFNEIRIKLVSVSRNPLHAWIDLKPQITSDGERRNFSDIIISIPGSSGFLVPGFKVLGYRNIHFRSHNAEILHRMDWLKAEVGLVRRLKIVRKLIFGTLSDFLVAFFSSTVLVISKVEVSKYWNNLFPLWRKKFIYFPYKPPSHLVKVLTDRKQNQRFVLIVGAYRAGTRISDADKVFFRNGAKIQDYFKRQGLELHSTGNAIFYDFCDVNWGFVEDLDVLMRSADFVLIPTSRGWGFKTKILDALFNNIGVIMTVRLAEKSEPYSDFYSVVSSWSAIEDTHLIIPAEEAFEELRLELNSQRAVLYSKLK